MNSPRSGLIALSFAVLSQSCGGEAPIAEEHEVLEQATSAIVLDNGLTYTGVSGSRGSELHFELTLAEGATGLRVALGGGRGDGDLYLRFGQKPTLTAWDHRPYLGSNNEVVEIEAPRAGKWFGMVRGYSAYEGATLGAVWSRDANELEEEALALINQRRAQGAVCGGRSYPPAPPLRHDSLLQVAARDHSTDMAERGYFAHTTPEGKTFDQRIRDAGYTGAGPWGENLAAGQSSAAQAVEGWMNSPGHCVNLMNPRFLGAGLGYVYRATSPYRHYWTHDFGGE